MQLEVGVIDLYCNLLRLFYCVFAANAFDATYVLVTGLMESSVLVIIATMLEMNPEKLMNLSLMCIFNGGKLLNMSKWALKTACGWLNLSSTVLCASL